MKFSLRCEHGKNRDGAESFDHYFAGIYGGRWPALKAALREDPRKSVIKNPFGLQDYALDEASLYPAKWLDVHAGMAIADLCASPGGKSLASIFKVKGKGRFHCNDLSSARVKRLLAVLHDCVPEEVLMGVRVTTGDASRFGLRHAGEFDRVLVDAPCSGERHLLASPRELSRWSEKSSKRLAVRQHALVCAGFDSLVPGGRMVYSTCSISPHENDAVVDKILKSREGSVRVVPVREEVGEATRHGWILLPDVTGCGPIYFSVLERADG
ncbi:MAG: hypothetical protein HC902_05720 [Calothrix sp. SM1_5_4]|nr:hypothetical protein [Calothrix sp. SM1_5_4]